MRVYESSMDNLMEVDGQSGKHPEFKGNVATVCTHPPKRSKMMVRVMRTVNGVTEPIS
jgi:hypothetical protein